MSRSSETTSAAEARQDDTEDRTQAPDVPRAKVAQADAN
jgi:hypothetical protein